MTQMVIGVTPLYDVQRDSVWMIPGYLDGITQAGGIPGIFPLDCGPKQLHQLFDMVDGVLFTGGQDVDPALYGEQRRETCGEICQKRDIMERELLQMCRIHQKPAFGICRGIQIMNVAAGGTLYQDLEIEGKFEHHFGDKYPRNYPWHDLTIEKGSILEKIYGKTEIRINSFHHQAVKDPGKDIEIIAKSADGVPEAIVQKNHPFSVAVQWHPEMMYDSDEQLKLLKAFVDACR